MPSKPAGSKWLLVFCWLALGGWLFAQQIWQGNAATIRRGEFEQSGLYAASNSFAPNTKILVENKATGLTATVTILRRIDDGSNVFLLLSEEAASTLGMDYYDVISVEVKVVEVDNSNVIGLPDDLPYNPDPDIISYFPPDETDLNLPTPSPTPAPYIQPTVTPTPGITPLPTITPVQELTPTPTPSQELRFTPVPTITPGVTPASITPAPSVSPIPPKNVFIPPREDTRSLLLDYNRPEMIREDRDFRLAEADLPPRQLPQLDDLTRPEPREKVADLRLQDYPAIEQPVFIDDPRAERPKLAAEERSVPDTPALAPRDLPVVSSEVPEAGEKEYVVISGEPELPGELLPDPAGQIPPVALEERFVLSPVEPVLPESKGNIPDVGGEVPFLKDRDLAYTQDQLSLPDAGRMETSGEIPEAGSLDTGERIALGDEPLLPVKTESGRPDVPGEVPRAGEETLAYREADILSPPVDNPQPGVVRPETAGETALALNAEEPIPPEKQDILRPELSGEIPDIAKSEFDFTAGEPTFPVENPDPSGTTPEAAEAERLALVPEDPDVLDKTPEPDIVVMGPTPTPIIIYTSAPTPTPIIIYTSEPTPSPVGARTPVPTIPPDSDSGETEITLVPVDLRPPVDDGSILDSGAKTPPLIAMEDRDDKSYFIQLGVYKEKEIAQDIEAEYAMVYPIDIYTPSSTNQVYKVLLGPLNKDESDTLLFRFRSLGFRDAFVKYIN